MAIPMIWIWSLLALDAAATATGSQQAIDSTSLSGMLPTIAVSSGTIVDQTTLVIRSGTEAVTSAITVGQLEDTKNEADPETVDGRNTTELDPSLQIGFLILGALLGLASVVVAVFFGYKQLSVTTNQSTDRHNDRRRSDDLELGELDAAGDEARTATDLPTRSSHIVDANFVGTLKHRVAHLSDGLKTHLFAIRSFIRRDVDHPDEPPNDGHDQHLRPDAVRD